jgi:hypothetical protein
MFREGRVWGAILFLMDGAGYDLHCTIESPPYRAAKNYNLRMCCDGRKRNGRERKLCRAF